MTQAVSAAPYAAATIRDVQGPAELRACQDVQRAAWGITEDGYLLPVATMVGAQKVGGLILGAFGDQNRLIGFAFAFLGRRDSRWILYSQLTGVEPAFQGLGVGRMLKIEQRRRAREMGLAAVVWAFDPLQASNAAFNLTVLGATSRSYETDFYGSRSDALNAGLATDRLFAEWSTLDSAAGRSEPWSDGVDLIETAAAEHGRYRLVRRVVELPRSATHVHVELPASIANIKSEAGLTAAQDWQLALRETLCAAFTEGFVTVGVSRVDPHQPRYLLERRA